MDNEEDAHNDLVNAALDVLRAERGGYDERDAEQEMQNALTRLDRAVVRYHFFIEDKA